MQRPVSKRHSLELVVGVRGSGSFTPLQLDVFHALWETYKKRDCRPRPESAPSKRERDTESRTKALRNFAVRTQVGRPFKGVGGVKRMSWHGWTTSKYRIGGEDNPTETRRNLAAASWPGESYAAEISKQGRRSITNGERRAARNDRRRRPSSVGRLRELSVALDEGGTTPSRRRRREEEDVHAVTGP